MGALSSSEMDAAFPELMGQLDAVNNASGSAGIDWAELASRANGAQAPRPKGTTPEPPAEG